MADFKTGHAQPAGFMAGAIKDGASLGLFKIKTDIATAPNGTFEVKVRNVSGKLVALTEIRLASGSVVESFRVKQAQYVINVANQWVVEKDNLLAIGNLVATISELNTLGVSDNGQVSGTATGAALGYEQNLSGMLTKSGTTPPPGLGTININKFLPDGTPNPNYVEPTVIKDRKKWLTYALVGVVVVLVAVFGYRAFKNA